MTSIVRATLNNSALLTHIGKTSFLESHGNSASKENVNTYISKKFTKKRNEKNIFISIHNIII